MKLLNLFESDLPATADTPKLLEMFLEKHAFTQVAHGLHSDVYSRPDDNFVLKVNKPPIDKAYLKFVEYVSNHKDNPNLPKLSKIRWYGKGDHKFYMIPIEKLKPMPDNSLANLMHVWLGYYTREQELTPELEKQLAPYKNLVKTIIDIEENLVGDGTILDLNTENFMLRGKTPVLIDPLANMNTR